MTDSMQSSPPATSASADSPAAGSGSTPGTPAGPDVGSVGAGSRSPRRPRPRWAGMVAVFWLALQVAACGDSPTQTKPDPGPPAGSIRIAAVTNLAPDGTGRLTGSNLDKIERLVVDGQPVSPSSVTPTVVEFPVPRTRPCDTDGRPVQVIANDTVRARGQIALPSSALLSLSPAESRVVTLDELECLQIGRGGESYVFTLADLSLEPGPGSTVLKLVARGTGEDEAVQQSAVLADAAAPTLEPAAHGVAGPAHDMPARVHKPGLGRSEGPFDDYANARVGDTVRMVDWHTSGWSDAATKEEVPTYDALVLAVEGDQMVVADMRSEEARAVAADPAVVAKIREAAAMASTVTLPALRALLHPALETPPDAGGRMLTLIRDLPPGTAGSILAQDIQDVEHVRWASDMFVALLAPVTARVSSPADIASTIVHEMGHLGDALNRRNMGGFARTSGGWYGEAMAVAMEDMAARMAEGGTWRVPLTKTQGMPLALGLTRFPLWRSHMDSPWGTEAGLRNAGWYNAGPRILRYAQGLMGQGEEWRLHSTLAERDVAADRPEGNPDRHLIFGIESVAEEVGRDGRTLLDEAILADVTFGLVERSAAEARGLPMVQGWELNIADINAWLGRTKAAQPFTLYELGRSRDTSGTLALVPGGYVARYIGSDPNRGVSLMAEDLGLGDQAERYRMRITRLR